VGGNDQVLHGAPHFGNLLNTPAGLLWTDFETACHGPLEWDLAGFPSGAEAMFPEADAQRLQMLRLGRSLAVSVKCWAQFGRAPEVDEAARYHLGLLHDWRKRPKGC
jgi:thiamine kinase-like enzyme